MFVHADSGTQCYVDGWGGVGWGDNVHVTRDAQRTAMLKNKKRCNFKTKLWNSGWKQGVQP